MNRTPRTYDALLSAIMDAWPTREEVAQLTPEQLKTLRGAGNCFDNVLFLATPEGRKVQAEAAARKAHAISQPSKENP